MADELLIDTDVLIDYLREQRQAVEFLETLPDLPPVSAITIAELYAGVREGKERKALSNLADGLGVIEVTKEIAQLGGLYRRDYFKSHGVGIIDAIIAATAEHSNRMLVTLNKKHFPMLPNILVPYQKT